MKVIEGVVDEFKKGIEFTQTPKLHLSILQPIYRFDILLGTLHDDLAMAETPIIASFQFNKRLTGDITERPIIDWEAIDVVNLLYGYFQVQLAVLLRTGHYHYSDGHPKNILFSNETTPTVFYFNDFGFTTGRSTDG